MLLCRRKREQAFADIPYDIEQKLQEINAHFEEDPTPIECDREVLVKFKEDIVDLVVPPSPSPSDSSDSFEGGHDAEYYLNIDYPPDFEEDSISKSAEDEEKDPEEGDIVNGQQQSTYQTPEEINTDESSDLLLENTQEIRAIGTDVNEEQNKIHGENETEANDLPKGHFVQSGSTEDNSKANELCKESSRGFLLDDKECANTKNENQLLLIHTVDNRNLTCALNSDNSGTEHGPVQFDCSTLSAGTLQSVSKVENDGVCRVVKGSEINKTNWPANKGKGQGLNMKRPGSARTTSKSVISGGKRFVQSARGRDRNIGQSVPANGEFQRKLPNYGGNARSQYGLPDREREKLHNERMKKLEEKKKKMQEEGERKKDKCNIADSAFKAWLEQKEVKKQGNCLRHSGTKPRKEWRDAEGAFRAWLVRKDEEELRENMLKFYEEQEIAGAKPKRSKEEAQKAYRAWLRSKNAQQCQQARRDHSQGIGFRQRNSFTLSQAQRQADVLKRTFQAYFGATL